MAFAPLPVVEGLAAALWRENIDTDIIIPSREITSPSREGYGAKAFAPWRYLAPGGPENHEFVLNREPWRRARVLVAGANFGCGSSREMAVWALVQFGLQAIVAPSFGTIFRNNCVRNGLVPVVLPQAAAQALARQAEVAPLELRIDVAAGELRLPDGILYHFELAPGEREMLLTGLDAIARTLELEDQIATFEARDRLARPWAWNF